MSSIHVARSLRTASVTASDVHCAGGCRHDSDVECAQATHIVFPYRGVYVRRVGQDVAVADGNQVLFFNALQEYRISHPVEGGDACVSLAVAPAVLEELAPAGTLQAGAFLAQHQRIDAQSQMLVAQLRLAMHDDATEPLKAETLMLSLLQHALGGRSKPSSQARHGQRRLVDRIKLTLASDTARRWTLDDIAAETGGSPVYLTQVFQQVEGIPLYRYQLQLRLQRALAVMAQCGDLSAVSFDLGFSSHSHFSASFRQAYGCSPSAFRKLANH
ncbi:helix-turn-helix domain-containing protein [Duganella sp. CY15W]|uniref:helix-turn-helix transcriptional regulator n=1 Tax=Duganella sp. CY15W TaxID=2692172 RepID=UPI00136F25B1|nr:AraC family transcriptional regulator [Duganella sp. CY15W]MYM28735.1 helix-turn-helix domain-containing protein [Duganella sp. CY15W]